MLDFTYLRKRKINQKKDVMIYYRNEILLLKKLLFRAFFFAEKLRQS